MIQTEDPKTSTALRHRLSAALSTPSSIVFLVLLLVVVGLHLYMFFTTMVLSPIGFDEAFNIQAPLNLVNGNGYSTEDWLNGGPRTVFDPVVSTGPIVEVPVALSFLLFGTSIEAARIVMLPYLVLLLASLFVLGRRAAGRWGGLVAVAVGLAINTRADFPFTMIYGPSDALGEYASAALIAFALVLLPRSRVLPGLVLGFAALAKFISFMAVPAFMIALLLVPVVRPALGRRRPIRELLAFAALAAAPSIGWELVKLISLGPVRYVEVLIEYGRFVLRSGSGADGGSREFIVERFARLFAAWHLPTTLVFGLAVILFTVAVIGLLRYYAPDGIAAGWRRAGEQGGKRDRVRAFASSIPLWVWAAAGTLAAFALWWVFVSSSTFIRHTMPMLLVAVPIVAALAVRGAMALFASGGLRRIAAVVFAVGLVAVIALQGALTIGQATRYDIWTRSGQEAAASFIKKSGFDEVQGISWWAAPAIRLASGVPSTPIGTGTGPLVLEPILKALDPITYQWGLDQCTDVLYDEDDFVICEVPDTVTGLDANGMPWRE